MDRQIERKHPGFQLTLRIDDPGFVSPPQANQRNWVLQRAVDELADELQHLDEVTRRFVPGSARPEMSSGLDARAAEYDDSQLVIAGQQVMQDWERPLMQAMAAIAAEQHGDVLEIGFGMGISAGFIQSHGVRSHTIIECNPEVRTAFDAWRAGHPGRDIRLVDGRWQDVIDQLGQFDAVFFDTYPLTEQEFDDYVVSDVTFAAHFFAAAARHLRPGGVFTYYSNEIDSASRRHQRALLRHFSSMTLSLQAPLAPPADCHYWWADSMVVVKAVK